MKNVNKDIDDILSLEDKKRLLKEIGQEDLLEMFKQDYKVKYTPPVSKKSPLDQQVAFSVSDSEKMKLSKELLEIKKHGPAISISAFVRNQVTSDIDIKGWAGKALKELKKLNSSQYDKSVIEKQRGTLIKLIDNAEEDSELEEYENNLEQLNKRLELLKKQSFKRKYRLAGRITFNEAQILRWRAARLNLNIADYLRYTMFNYEPGSEADLNLSLEDRKRFYISILDVSRNGWGEPQGLEDTPEVIRLRKEIQVLKEQIERYKRYAEKGGSNNV